MTNHDDRTDALDRLLTGEADDGALSAFLAQARSSLTTPVDEDTAQRHLAEIVEVAQEHAHTAPAPAATPTTRVGRWRRRAAQVLGYTATKIALGVGVAAAATGGLAATDSLPDAVQGPVSTGASYIGVDFPHPNDDLEGSAVEDLPTLPSDDGSERWDDTRGAEVDPPADQADVTDDVPADEAPVDEVPADDDAPPADEADTGTDTADTADEEAPVDTDAPPSDEDEARDTADDAADQGDTRTP